MNKTNYYEINQYLLHHKLFIFMDVNGCDNLDLKPVNSEL